MRGHTKNSTPKLKRQDPTRTIQARERAVAMRAARKRKVQR